MTPPEKKFVPPRKNTVHSVGGYSHGVEDTLLDRIKEDLEKRLTKQEIEVPALPQVASRILQLSNDPAAGMEQIERLVRGDAFLAGKVLALVNSAFYAGRQRVASLKQAVALLGLRTLRDLIFSISLHQKIFRAKRYEGLMSGNWAHSIGSATSTSILAERLKIERENAFLCGLLHDIGRPVLLNSIIETEEGLLGGQQVGEDSAEILLADFHEVVGGAVAQRWNLAPNVIEAIRHHHHPAHSREHHVLAAVVYCGDLMAEHLGFGSEPRERDFTLDPVFNELQIANADEMGRLLAQTRDQAQAFLNAFSG